MRAIRAWTTGAAVLFCRPRPRNLRETDSSSSTGRRIGLDRNEPLGKTIFARNRGYPKNWSRFQTT